MMHLSLLFGGLCVGRFALQFRHVWVSETLSPLNSFVVQVIRPGGGSTSTERKCKVNEKMKRENRPFLLVRNQALLLKLTLMY